MYKQTNEKFDFSTAELACIYIKKHKIWHDSCISLHPNVECCYLSSEDSIPVVEIKINKDATFSIQPKEGFKGKSCVEETKNLELVLGGEKISQEKTSDYYKGGPTNVRSTINLD